MLDLFSKSLSRIIAVMLSWGLIFHYIDNFYVIQENIDKSKKFGF